MVQGRYVAKIAAWLEIVVGVIFVVVPDIPCVLVFGAQPENIAGPLARWVGVSLLALGIACLPRRQAEPTRSALLGLLVFNVGAAILFAWFGVATTHGSLLWPAVILHALIALALAEQLLSPKAVWRIASRLHEITSRGDRE